MSKKKIIIIGASGLIGQKLYKELKNDYKIFVVGRDVDKLKNIFPEAECINWQKQAEELVYILEKAYAVINLAGRSIQSKRWTEFGKNTISVSRTSIIQQFYNLIQKTKKKPKQWIQASAVGFYGNTIDKTNENNKKGKGFLADLSFLMEEEANLFKNLNIKVISLRTGLVLDKNGGLIQKMKKPFQFHMGGHLGKGNSFFPWIHMSDEVRAIHFLIQNENAEGPINLCSPKVITQKEFCKELAKAMNTYSWLHIPKWLLKLSFGKQMANELFLQGQNCFPSKLLELGFEFNYHKIDHALTDIFKNNKSKN
ncbi:MAG: TIGR01777 family oxidoreductase [Bacteroidales bacterium]